MPPKTGGVTGRSRFIQDQPFSELRTTVEFKVAVT